MAPRQLINRLTGVIFDFTPDLAKHPDLETYYGEEEAHKTPETAKAAAEVETNASPPVVQNVPAVPPTAMVGDKPAVAKAAKAPAAPRNRSKAKK